LFDTLRKQCPQTKTNHNDNPDLIIKLSRNGWLALTRLSSYSSCLTIKYLIYHGNTVFDDLLCFVLILALR
jgi:hypothetical protein